MTTCLGKRCLFSVLCAYFVNGMCGVCVCVCVCCVCVCVCVCFHFGFEGEMYDLIVLIPDHHLSIYLSKTSGRNLNPILRLYHWF